MKLTSVSESGRTLRRSTMFAGFILLAVSGLHLLASFSFNTCTWLVDGILLGLSPGASVGAQVAVAVVLLSVLRMFLPGALLHATIFVGYDSRGRRGRGGCLPAILSTPFVYLAQLSVALLSGIDILATVLDLDETRPDAKCDSVRRQAFFFFCVSFAWVADCVAAGQHPLIEHSVLLFGYASFHGRR